MLGFLQDEDMKTAFQQLLAQTGTIMNPPEMSKTVCAGDI